MRKFVTLALLGVLFALSGCGPGDTSAVHIDLGASKRFTHAEVQAAADAVLADFHRLSGCSLKQLTYDETFSDGQASLETTPASGDVLVFTAVFVVNSDDDGTLEAGSTQSWTWTVKRDGPGTSWRVTNHGVG